ncbi:MAG: signal peptidase II [Anaerolineae bacterium]|nr:signal peptidase II [Anaerolineae bacterium]
MRPTSRLRQLCLFVIAACVIALDQYTKWWVRAHIPVNRSWNPIPWLDRFVTLTHVENTGVAFGLFKGLNWLFVIVAAVVIVLIVVYYRRLAATSWVLHVAFGLQLAGALGNQIDRVLHGYVTDFIDVRVWPIFNIADSSIVVGTALLAYYAFFLDRGLDQEPAPEELSEEPVPHPEE